MSHTVTKRAGRLVVKFECPSCQEALESPLDEAGQEFPCPNCSKIFVTPGVEELRKANTEKAARAREEAEARSRAEALRLAEVSALAEKRAAELEEERQLRQGPPDYDGIVFGATLLRILCVITWVCAGATVAQWTGRGFDSPVILYAGWLFVVGALLWMAASVGLAIRDMARNSFRG